MCTGLLQFAHKNLSFALVQLENRIMQTFISIQILQRYGVVLVSEQADDSAASVWRRAFSHHHRFSAHLFVLLAGGEVLDGTHQRFVSPTRKCGRTEYSCESS